MPVTPRIQSGTTIVEVCGGYTPEQLRDFRQRCEQALESTECKQLDLDLAAIGGLDSSMLGVLLLIREKSVGLGKTMRLLDVQGQALKHLQAARFDRMFLLA